MKTESKVHVGHICHPDFCPVCDRIEEIAEQTFDAVAHLTEQQARGDWEWSDEEIYAAQNQRRAS